MTANVISLAAYRALNGRKLRPPSLFRKPNAAEIVRFEREINKEPQKETMLYEDILDHHQT